MSGLEDSQDASEQDDTQDETTETVEVSDEVASTIEESDSSELSEKSSTKDSEEEREEVKEKEPEEEVKEKEREEIKETETKETPICKETQEEETSASELATVTRSASSDDGVPVSGVAARQVEPGVGVPLATAVHDGDGQQRRISGGVGVGAAIGEWNSLPILVERLREALELSLAGLPAGCRRGGDGVGAGTDGVGDRSTCARRSMEQALLGSGHDCDHDVPILSRKDELKFLEDLLLSDIQTALSRLRETLERTDVATLAKHGGVSDPTSKLHLLRLVSSLLSRLQVPVEERESGSSESVRTIDVAPPGRRRRLARHTIGVSAEEIARARRQLEESNADLTRPNDQVFPIQRPESLLSASHNGTSGEIHDKYTKDVINQRQSLRDKNKDTSGYRSLAVPPQIDYADRPAPRTADVIQHRDGVDAGYQEKVSDEVETAIKRASEEQSRVTKLAAALRQRAELISAGRCNNSGNKFATKKSKVKRANTIDIPSYLKLQTDNPGCILLRRPINVGDKITGNASNLGVPSFQPRTENDKKFLALIRRNNETQAYNAAPAFVKSLGCTNATDMSSQKSENWNSRFSNIKTAFDKPLSTNDTDKLQSPRPLQNTAKRFTNIPRTSPQIPVSKKTPTDSGPVIHNGFPLANANVPQLDTGFRHAPSSLFRKIEKPRTPISPPGNWLKDNASPSGNSLRERAKMFDNQPQSVSFNENTPKSAFPRPPWIEHDRNENNRSNKTVTENGRLDYRQFCKQFAPPFIGKNVAPEVKSIEDSRKHNEQSNTHRKNLAPFNEKLGVVDGKISFRMFPERGSQVQHHSNEPRRAVEESVRDKFDTCNEKNVFKPLAMVRNDKDSFKTTCAGNAPIDAMLRGSSSVAIQTGVDDHPEEARVFRVTPRVAKGPPSAYNNVSVQTYESEMEAKERSTTPRYNDAVPMSNNYRSVGDSSHFVLDHNRNYHALTIDVGSRNETLPSANKNTCNLIKGDTPYSTEKVPFQSISGPQSHEPIFQSPSPRCENYFSPKSAVDPTYMPYVKSNKSPFEDRMLGVSHETGKEDSLSDGALPEEQNIQNQDISAHAGVVTRYTCAIATVASADVPTTRINEIRPESEMSPSSLSSLSPLQLWYPKLSDGETTTTEDEIRRHNMLQQSLVRHLQNERATLNDHQSAPVSVNQGDNFNQPNVVNHSGNFNKPNNFHQSNSFNQSLRFQPLQVPKSPEMSKRPIPPRKPEPPKRSEPPRKLEPPRRLESPKRFEPPAVVTGLLSVGSSSGFGAKNRITALRQQYEQPGTQSKPIQKERSPIPNGTSGAMDSSDEYLVSCINRPSRSIVLTKSESWHQLALSKGHHAPSRSVQSNLPPQPYAISAGSYLPKPPKPKSPSSFKLKKQYEASSSSDSVKKMEDKIRRYFDHPTNDNVAETMDSKSRRFSSRDSVKKSLVSLSRSRTMPGICDENLRLAIPAVPQISVASLNSAEVDKVFDDIFEEATRTNDHRF